MLIKLSALITSTAIITSSFTVRVHSGIARYRWARWARLWYLLRALDTSGCGFHRVRIDEVCILLNAKPSTIREWLQLGKFYGAFKFGRERKGIITVVTGSLVNVAKNLDLSNWGETVETPLSEFNSLQNFRAWITGGVTQALQQQSHYAARAALSEGDRRRYRIPKPEQFFPEDTRPSDIPRPGVLACVLHIGPHRVFTSKGFIPYGCRQITIAEALNYRSDRTIRRHHQLLGLERRQLVQAKGEYTSAQQFLSDPETKGDFKKGDVEILTLRQRAPVGSDWPYIRQDRMWEKSGHAEYVAPDGYRVNSDRFFRYWNKTWIYRCNLYRPQFKLRTMAHRKDQLEKLMARQQAAKKIGFESDLVVTHSIANGLGLSTRLGFDSDINDSYESDSEFWLGDWSDEETPPAG